jgi:hypothetical protein
VGCADTSEKEHKDWRDIETRTLKRLWVRVKHPVHGRERLSALEAKEEAEYVAARTAELAASARLDLLKNQSASLQQQVAELSAAADANARAAAALQALYARAFDGPTPAFPQEDAAEMAYQGAVREYEAVQGASWAEGEALRLLAEADRLLASAIKTTRGVSGRWTRRARCTADPRRRTSRRSTRTAGPPTSTSSSAPSSLERSATLTRRASSSSRPVSCSQVCRGSRPWRCRRGECARRRASCLQRAGGRGLQIPAHRPLKLGSANRSNMIADVFFDTTWSELAFQGRIDAADTELQNARKSLGVILEQVQRQVGSSSPAAQAAQQRLEHARAALFEVRRNIMNGL